MEKNRRKRRIKETKGRKKKIIRVHRNKNINENKNYFFYKLLLLILFLLFKNKIKYNKEEYLIHYLKKINLKDIKFENRNISIRIIQNKLKEIYIKNNIFNKLDLSNNSDINIKKNSPNYYRSTPLSLNNISYFNISRNPYISVIIPIYNSELELFSLHKSIQDQSLKNIEIIYIDNNSTDNSTFIIEKFQKRDNRIILLKNKGNKGPFYSRNKGAIFAKGEYIQFIDSDDTLYGNLLEKVYLTAKLKNIDIIQYRLYDNFYILKEKIKKNVIMIQPELSNHMYYGTGRLKQTNLFIFNKIIKRDIFLKALIYMGVELINEHLFYNEDLLQLFCVLRVANSFLYIKDIGYSKLKRVKKMKSLIGNAHNPELANKILYDNFIEVKFIFNKTNNNEKDKAICYNFLRMTKISYSKIFKYITQGYELFSEVFNLLLNSNYIINSQKLKIEKLRKIIMGNHT